MYKKLHERRVAHIDIQPRHILRDKTGKLSLIDFEGAVEGADDETLREEMEQLNDLLYGDM